ncbi:hypothetical protein B0H13DRAFT_1918837 [Mycena leptocephala]|nr:hypothetical protein B0H13DRAFT_1918837 [Mycena leptocephala]
MPRTSSPTPPPSTQRSNPTKSLWDLVLDFVPKKYHAEGLPNPRMTSPWLMRTGWPKHMVSYCEHNKELMQLVSLPSEDEFPVLREVVASYFSTVTDLIEHTNEVVLQCLNSADPIKEWVFSIYKATHLLIDLSFVVGLTTCRCMPTTKETKHLERFQCHCVLASFTLAVPEHYCMPVTKQLKCAVQSVLTSFTDSTDLEEHCSKLHQLLLALWKTKWEATENHTIHNPTMCLALSSLERSGEFAGPKETTGPIAKLCWGIKLCMLTQIHVLVRSGECKDQLETFEMIAPFVIEHELTTFHHLCSLIHYATTPAFTTMEAPSIVWTDREDWRELLYLGRCISLEYSARISELV